MIKELTRIEDEDVPQSESMAIIFKIRPVENEVNGLIHSGRLVEMANAIRDLGFDCSGYTDEELAKAYEEIVR